MAGLLVVAAGAASSPTGPALVLVIAVVGGDELVVVLSPCEDLRPVTQVVADDGKAIAPGLDNGLHVVVGVLVAMRKAFVNLGSFLNNVKYRIIFIHF